MRDIQRDKELDKLIAESAYSPTKNIDELLKGELEKITDPKEKDKVVAIINEHKEKWAEEDLVNEKENKKKQEELRDFFREQREIQDAKLKKVKLVIWSVGIIVFAAYFYIKYGLNV